MGYRDDLEAAQARAEAAERALEEALKDGRKVDRERIAALEAQLAELHAKLFAFPKKPDSRVAKWSVEWPVVGRIVLVTIAVVILMISVITVLVLASGN